MKVASSFTLLGMAQAVPYGLDHSNSQVRYSSLRGSQAFPKHLHRQLQRKSLLDGVATSPLTMLSEEFLEWNLKVPIPSTVICSTTAGNNTVGDVDLFLNSNLGTMSPFCQSVTSSLEEKCVVDIQEDSVVVRLEAFSNIEGVVLRCRNVPMLPLDFNIPSRPFRLGAFERRGFILDPADLTEDSKTVRCSLSASSEEVTMNIQKVLADPNTGVLCPNATDASPTGDALTEDSVLTGDASLTRDASLCGDDEVFAEAAQFTVPSDVTQVIVSAQYSGDLETSDITILCEADGVEKNVLQDGVPSETFYNLEGPHIFRMELEPRSIAYCETALVDETGIRKLDMTTKLMLRLNYRPDVQSKIADSLSDNINLLPPAGFVFSDMDAPSTLYITVADESGLPANLTVTCQSDVQYPTMLLENDRYSDPVNLTVVLNERLLDDSSVPPDPMEMPIEADNIFSMVNTAIGGTQMYRFDVQPSQTITCIAKARDFPSGGTYHALYYYLGAKQKASLQGAVSPLEFDDEAAMPLMSADVYHRCTGDSGESRCSFETFGNTTVWLVATTSQGLAYDVVVKCTRPYELGPLPLESGVVSKNFSLVAQQSHSFYFNATPGATVLCTEKSDFARMFIRFNDKPVLGQDPDLTDYLYDCVTTKNMETCSFVVPVDSADSTIWLTVFSRFGMEVGNVQCTEVGPISVMEGVPTKPINFTDPVLYTMDVAEAGGVKCNVTGENVRFFMRFGDVPDLALLVDDCYNSGGECFARPSNEETSTSVYMFVKPDSPDYPMKDVSIICEAGIIDPAEVFGPMSQGAPATDTLALSLGVPSTPFDLVQQQVQVFAMKVATGAESITCALEAETGDLDLYVNIGRVPTEEDFDCISAGDTASESCTLLLGSHYMDSPAEVFVLVLAYERTAAATLTCKKGVATTVSRGIPPLML